VEAAAQVVEVLDSEAVARATVAKATAEVGPAVAVAEANIAVTRLVFELLNTTLPSKMAR